MPKIRAELADQGIHAGKNRIAHIMRGNRWRGVSKRRSYVVTTRRDEKQRPAPDLVDRQFVAEAPNQLWVADMTYVPTWQGFVFLAIVLDLWSRRVVGMVHWAKSHQRTLRPNMPISSKNRNLT